MRTSERSVTCQACGLMRQTKEDHRMEWVFGLLFIALIVILGIRNANHGYTAGSNLFKSSEANLAGEEHLDPSDYEYYNKNGKFR